MRSQLLPLFFILFQPCFVHAQILPSDLIAKNLETAKSQFTKEMNGARSTLNNAMARLIKRTEANRRLSTEQKIADVDALKSEQKAFTESGRLPSSRQLRSYVASFQRTLRVQLSRVEEAFDDAAEEYDDAGKLNAARTVLEDKEAFLKNAALPMRIDGFHAGAVWKGIRYAKPSGTKKPTVLIVQRRSGNEFSGTISVTNPRVETVSKFTGTIADGKIVIKFVESIQNIPFVLRGSVTNEKKLILDKDLKPPASQRFEMTLVSEDGGGTTK